MRLSTHSIEPIAQNEAIQDLPIYWHSRCYPLCGERPHSSKRRYRIVGNFVALQFLGSKEQSRPHRCPPITDNRKLKTKYYLTHDFAGGPKKLFKAFLHALQKLTTRQTQDYVYYPYEN